jgi:hypothetical protein
MSSNSTSLNDADRQETSSSIITTNCRSNLTELPISDLTLPLAEPTTLAEAISSAEPTSSAEPIPSAEPTSSSEPTPSAGTPDNDNNNQTQQLNEETDDDITLASCRHSEIRKRATKTYLSNANKKIKIHDQFIKDLSLCFSIGDYVGVKIDKVDRTNTDPKILPSIVLEKQHDKIKIACEFGIINQWWSLDSIVPLSTVPETIVNLDTSQLKEISLITSSRLYIRGGADPR